MRLRTPGPMALLLALPAANLTAQESPGMGSP